MKKIGCRANTLEIGLALVYFDKISLGHIQEQNLSSQENVITEQVKMFCESSQQHFKACCFIMTTYNLN